jgi:conjugal transfer pilus assembly protein TraU
VAASAGFPLNSLFWCAGCQGSMYPLTGWVGSHVSAIQASSLLTQRITNKLHREGLMWSASGSESMCSYTFQPIMDKTNYKTQMIYPVASTNKVFGKCCNPYGRTTVHWQSGKEIPYRGGENFSYQIYRKRDCCQGAF